MVSESLQFYVDTLIIETILTDPRITKQAQSGLVSSLVSKVFGYFHDKVSEVEDSDHKLDMVINFITPGILTAFGFPVLGFLVKISQMLFGFDFAKIFGEIVSEIKSLVVGGTHTNSSAVDSVVSKAVMSNLPADPTEEQLKSMKVTIKLILRDAELFKIALADYLSKNPDVNLQDPEINVKFAAGLFGSSLATFVGSKHKTTKILISVIGWIVKAALAACGFMVAGEAINAIVGGKSSSIDGQPKNKDNETANVVNNAPVVTLPVNPQYSEESFNGPMSRWIISNDITSIDNLLSSWAQDIYPSVKGHENLIRYSNTFKTVCQIIKEYNKGSPPNMIFIPRQWKSTKDVVDQFMGEVQSNLGKLPSAPDSSNPTVPLTPVDKNINPLPNYTPEPKANQGTSI